MFYTVTTVNMVSMVDMVPRLTGAIPTEQLETVSGHSNYLT